MRCYFIIAYRESDERVELFFLAHKHLERTSHRYNGKMDRVLYPVAGKMINPEARALIYAHFDDDETSWQLTCP